MYFFFLQATNYHLRHVKAGFKITCETIDYSLAVANFNHSDGTHNGSSSSGVLPEACSPTNSLRKFACNNVSD